MRVRWLWLPLFFYLAGGAGSLGGAQALGSPELLEALVRSYDLLEAGKLEEAKKIYLELLQKHPDNPVVLNNLGAICAKEKDYPQALEYLAKALAQARGYKVLVNKVCDLEGVCLAFRPAAVEYGHHDLEPLVAVNLEMVRAKAGAGRKGD
jgi:tetratricopeptide (TPR) repeat protein|uniref:Tetratricopeptide repeat protein n=1 Tax=Desulfobacca acetoxidans TaxID=60893 RepID=A0A7C5AM46_9BACT